MEVAGVAFGAVVSGEVPPGTGWTGPGAGWQPRSWQTACREMGVRGWVLAKDALLSAIPAVLFPSLPPHSSSLCWSPCPWVHFLASDNPIVLTTLGGKC